MKHKNNKSIAKLLNIFIIALITLEVLAIALTFAFYSNEDESLYYNKTRLICARKVEAVEKSFGNGDNNFETWKYPYAVLDNKGGCYMLQKVLIWTNSKVWRAFFSLIIVHRLNTKGILKAVFQL